MRVKYRNQDLKVNIMIKFYYLVEKGAQNKELVSIHLV